VTAGDEPKQILALARALALEAGAIQRNRYESDLDIQTKSASIDLVTEVDKQCEALIVEGIERERPGDSILAEEGGGREREGADWRWVIDPLDGTTNFAHGFPRFCVSIGVEHRGKRAVGVVYDPLLDELFWALRGGGAHLCGPSGERRIHTSAESELGRALVATGFAYDVHRSSRDNLAEFGAMLKTVRGIRRDGSAALDLCYLAAGRVDAYWELKLHAWDVAAGLLILEEAGGRASDLRGGPAPASGAELVASNGPLHEQVLAVVAG